MPLIPEQQFKGGPRNNASNYLLPPWSVAQRIYILFVQAPVASYTITTTTTTHPPRSPIPRSRLDTAYKQAIAFDSECPASCRKSNHHTGVAISCAGSAAGYHRPIHTFRPVVKFVARSEHGMAPRRYCGTRALRLTLSGAPCVIV